jgi:hypothetical protein
VGPLMQVTPSQGLLGAALVLARHERAGAPVLSVELGAGGTTRGTGPLARHAEGNAMAPMLPLFDALALDGIRDTDTAILPAGPGRALTVRIHW